MTKGARPNEEIKKALEEIERAMERVRRVRIENEAFLRVTQPRRERRREYLRRAGLLRD